MKYFCLCAGLIVTMGLLGGCASPSGDPAAQAAMPETVSITADNLEFISGRALTLEQLTIDGAAIALHEPRPTLQLEKIGRIHGSGSINRYFGTFQYDAGQSAWQCGNVTMTRMAGDPELMQQETDFVDALRQVQRISLTHQKADNPVLIVLSSRDEKMVMSLLDSGANPK